MDKNPFSATCNYVADSATCAPATAISEGAHTLGATIEDFAGNVSNPVDVNFTIDVTAPAITVTAPDDGLYTNQASLNLTGSVSEPVQLKINTTIFNLYSDLSYSRPFTLDEGVNTFHITATDRAGNRSQVIRTVTLDTVPPPAPNGGLIDISSSGATSTVTGRPGGVEGGAEVIVTNSHTGESVTVIANADGSFAAQIGAQPDDEITVTARDRAKNRSEETLLQVPVDLKVLSPGDGTSIQGDFVYVSGELWAPSNTGVVINNVVAAIADGSDVDRFAAQIPLQPGTNTIEVRATRQDGGSVTRSLTVTRSGPAPFEISADTNQGMAPLEVTYSVANPNGHAIYQIEFDFDGNGTTDVYADADTPVTHTYATPGIRYARIRVRYWDSEVKYAVETIPIVVLDQAQIDQTLRAVWTGLDIALRRGETERAVQFVTDGSRETYSQLFQILQPRMADILNELTHIEPVGISGNVADYAVMSVYNDQSRVFFINFLRDVDGVWRIDSM